MDPYPHDYIIECIEVPSNDYTIECIGVHSNPNYLAIQRPTTTKPPSHGLHI